MDKEELIKEYNKGYNNGVRHSLDLIDRDEIAIHALQGVLAAIANPNFHESARIIATESKKTPAITYAEMAYELADAMIAVRTRESVV